MGATAVAPFLYKQPYKQPYKHTYNHFFLRKIKKSFINIWQKEKIVVPLQPLKKTKLVILQGEMVEWSITTVLKTVVPRGTGGSNPSLSAQSPVNRKIYGTFLFCTFK